MDLLASTLVEYMGIPENYAEHGGSVDHMIDVVHWFMLALLLSPALSIFEQALEAVLSRGPV